MTDFPKSEKSRFSLYGAAVSPYVRKIRVLMAEKNVPYDLFHVNVFAPPPWFAAISPLRRIPVLHDAEVPGDGLLRDSSIIAAYLDRLFPEPALFPSNPWEFAQALWLEEYIDADFIARMGPEVFFPRVVGPLMGGTCDEALVHKGMTQSLPPFFAYLNKTVTGREFAVGDRLTIADISLASPFVNLRHAGEAADPATYPALNAFLDRMLGRASFMRVIAHETSMLARARKLA